ncbi:MAG: hypothetical protein A2Z05_06525, partial [Chloroflexi bacterium RBG_16_60_22]
PAGLRSLPGDELARLIYSCGYYNVKARKLKAFVRWLGEEYRDDLDGMLAVDTGVLRRQLLGIYGIGEETADSILLYAAGKPSFVIDAYTRRIVGRLGLDTGKCTYAACQALFTDNLPADASLYNEYHALLVQLGKDVCRTRPRCGPCCLNPGSLNDPASPSAAFPCAALVRR